LVLGLHNDHIIGVIEVLFYFARCFSVTIC